jgi:hypothetical protein
MRRWYPFESGSVRVASSKGVSATESHDFLIRESHTVEDVANVFVTFGSIGKSAIGSTGCKILIGTTWSPRNDGSTHFLERTDSSKSPEIRISDPRELLLYFFEVVAGNLETGIGTVIGFRGETLQSAKPRKGMYHSSTVASAGTSFFIVGAAGVPCKSNNNRTETSIIVIVSSLFQSRGDGIVYSLIIAWLANFLGTLFACSNTELTGRSYAICVTGLFVVVVSSCTDEGKNSNHGESP